MHMPPRTQRSITALLLVLCAGLAVLAYGELIAAQRSPGDSLPALSVRAAHKQSDESARPFSLPPLASFSAVTARPLFSPTRRPPPQPEGPKATWSDFALAGIVISPQSREALVLHGNPPTVEHLRKGQTIEGWTVTSIFPDRVIFRDGAAEHELSLVGDAPQVAPRRAPPQRRRFR